MTRMGIFGGSFDPVHIGHLWIAEAAIELLGLDQVRWIPAATSPLKPNGAIASAEDRVQMLRLALSGNERYAMDEREIHRGEISYTVDTISELIQEFPNTDFRLIIGSDSLASFQQWHQPRRLLELVTPAVVQRGGQPPVDFGVLRGLATPQRISEIESQVIQMPVIELSSSELRQRIATGRSIRYRTTRSVEALIDARGLYQMKVNCPPS